MKKNQNKLLVSLLVLVLTASTSLAQISGQTSAAKGSTLTYIFDNGSLITGIKWIASNSTNISSTTVNGTAYSVNITWSTTASSGTITVSSPGTGTLGTLSVTLITCSGI